MTKKERIKSYVLRVDQETMEAIEKWAADEFRSTNGQLQWIITEALRKSGRVKKIKSHSISNSVGHNNRESNVETKMNSDKTENKI